MRPHRFSKTKSKRNNTKSQRIKSLWLRDTIYSWTQEVKACLGKPKPTTYFFQLQSIERNITIVITLPSSIHFKSVNNYKRKYTSVRNQIIPKREIHITFEWKTKSPSASMSSVEDISKWLLTFPWCFSRSNQKCLVEFENTLWIPQTLINTLLLTRNNLCSSSSVPLRSTHPQNLPYKKNR